MKFILVIMLTIISFTSIANECSNNKKKDKDIFTILSASTESDSFKFQSNQTLNTNLLYTKIYLERSGCCSHHNGVCGCSNGKAQCCDGVMSPSCGCD